MAGPPRPVGAVYPEAEAVPARPPRGGPSWQRALSGIGSTEPIVAMPEFTQDRAMAATRERHTRRLTNEAGTKFQNEARNAFQNEGIDDDTAIA